MGFYSTGKRWKILLMLIGAMILVVSLYYSNHLANQLLINEQKNINLYKRAVDGLIQSSAIEDSQEITDDYLELLTTIVDSFPLPVIYEDERGALEGINFGTELNNDSLFLQNQKHSFLNQGLKPIQFTGYASNIYYFNSKIIDRLKLFPIIQLSLIALYIALGYFLFSTSRREEESRIWAGLAKETAHQLGTPISAIIGWIEFMRLKYEEDPENMDIVNELSKDVNRLELVADRFSKIGSEPLLEPTDIYKTLIDVRDYLKRRAARRVTFQFDAPEEPIVAAINPHLFSWVIENLIRNALDAMTEEGRIGCKMYKQHNNAIIEISDTGHGIPSGKFKTIFKPGFSTKKRGWGLGLSLSKRIVEDYHKGKIYVKSSVPNKETIFCISLPLA
ncbi:MAG: HAMP domain-containing histidine kinase [Lewinellaceae bacterium]|nr:HAMP domain-containing histidine kinase [Lewinellaceae bacterium]